MNKTEQQMLDNEEWTANLKFCVGDLSIPQWIGVLTLIEQKIRASNARTRLSVLEEVAGGLPKIKHSLEEVAEMNKDLPSTLQESSYHESRGFIACLAQITQIINEMKLK